MRGLLGGGALVAVASLRLPWAAARPGTSGPGEPCRHDRQCLAADAPLVCAWNGFGYDGDYNCCTFEGGRCFDDAGCCGYSICAGGFCISDDFGAGAGAGAGGVARSSADGGTVSVGNINSGGNRGNVISVGDGSGDRRISGGNVANDTSVSISADGGTAISDASGGSGNISGGSGDGSWADCGGVGCGCYQGRFDSNPCGGDLVCCYDAGYNGVCVSDYTCDGFGRAGDFCPAWCDPADSCSGCFSGFCTWNGYCA